MGEQQMTHTSNDLKELQALPLYLKVAMTKRRIRDWVSHYGEDGVYVSFSGGKDSTVLLHLVREEFPNVPGVFCDTSLEFPEIRDFVKTFDNITWLKPKKNFRQVLEDYGFPFISKEISRKVYECRVTERKGKESYARRQFEGTYVSKNGKSNQVSVTAWKFLLDCPYEISHMCCNVMKKNPSKLYENHTGRYPMLGQMAEESKLRRQEWLKHGCNGFDKKRPTSNPMSFWTEQDVLQYIKGNDIPICSVYGDIVEDPDGKLHTTGRSRTGCIFCGFGCHLQKEGEGNFELLRESHPKLYEYIMKPWDEGGLGYKEVIDWLNENGNLHIRY